MQLIGMLDSPYVRRVAISLRVMGLSFEHRAVSVFSTFEEFHAINPVVKAPTLVCDDSTVLMDSTLILDYAEALSPKRSLMPAGLAEQQQALRILGLALAATEKSVQLVYEQNLRPPEKQHAPWVVRVTGQITAAYAALEAEIQRTPPACDTGTIMQVGITSAVAWDFTQTMLPGLVAVAAHPALQALSARAEQLPAFLEHPPSGPGVPPQR
jgi:glutathione S-transferase